MRTALILFLLGLAPAAVAGSGPWTLSGDDMSTYVGASYTRWRHFAGGDGSFGDVVELPAAVTRSDLQVGITYGLLPGAEVEVSGGVGWSGIGNEDAPVCSFEGACDSTLGLTPITARTKLRLTDELRGAPLTAAVGGELRFGDFTRDTRMRITALGDGQTDLAAFASVGRQGALGSWSYATYVELLGRHRLLSTEIDGQKVPADELGSSGEFLVYPTPNASVGVAYDVLHALGGLDFSEDRLDDPDRFTSLSVSSVKAGGKLAIRSVANTTVNLSVLGTVYGRNNPADFFTVGFGIGTFRAGGDR
ncbi:MAG: hypothetical protein EP330_10740 [Deltaproteobacteria bacterium]|nr:MAG: hypothetical protein EP330_10740 [Deltaproteobacteria bacterium]